MNRISTKLGHNHLWVTGYKSYDISWPQIWPRGHRGQKRSNLRKVSTPQRYKVWSWNFGAWMVLTFSTKVMGWQKYVGSNGVTGVKIKGQIVNFVRFQRLRCQIVHLEPTIKSVHGDLFVRPFLQGSKVKKRSNKGPNFNFNRFQRLMCQIFRL